MAKAIPVGSTFKCKWCAEVKEKMVYSQVFCSGECRLAHWAVQKALKRGRARAKLGRKP